MSLSSYLALAALVMFASGIQRITGFSFSLFAVAGSMAFGIADLWEITVVVTFLLCFNATIGLITSRTWPQIKLLFIIMAGVVPGTVAGLALMHGGDYISAKTADIALGTFMIAAALMLSAGTTSKRRWGKPGMLAIGGMAGITGGAFGAPGPPLVYGLYRQPIPLEEVRATLFAIFLGFAVFRSGFAIYSGTISAGMIWMFAFALPAAVIGAQIGYKLIGRMATHHIRRVAVGVLLISGLVVIVRAVLFS